MSFGDVTKWVEEHPTESIVIGAGGLIAILWLLGYFSSSSSSSSSNLATAYYSAEAQQAVVGGQIQEANIAATASTAQAALQANAAVAIQQSQSGAATTINGQNASAATTINQQTIGGDEAMSSDQLLATYSNNAATVATNASNNAASVSIAGAQAQAGEMSSILNTIIPQEMASTMQHPGATGGTASIITPWGNFQVSPAGGYGNLNDTMAQGYTLDQALKLSDIGTGLNL